MNTRTTLGLMIVSLLINSMHTFAGQSADRSESTETSAPYLRVLEALRKNTAVRPPMPDLHPVNMVYNREAIIPPQCYTRTEGKYNPCYVCHQNSRVGRENVMNDGDLQSAYSFSDVGMTNHWRNLFEDRSARVAQISDDAIAEWIKQDNYSDLPKRLRAIDYQGWIPDLDKLQQGAAAFGEYGVAKDGSAWVAFNYKPMPSTFWPTNGSTDDVMIRLPSAYRANNRGDYSLDVYLANLAILEANIKELPSIGTPPINENAIESDLNGDGKLSVINEISKVDAYVGAARSEFIDTYLYPEGTEFLHTVRYLGLADDGSIGPSTRMKEVRYMRKWRAYRKPVYARYYQQEGFEKEAGNLPGYFNVGDHGLDNGMGWSLNGFIEDKNGNLRMNTFEENLFCMGCHNSIGSTIDKTFSFARKVDGATGWGYINLKGMPDAPNVGEQQGEILTYLERVGGGGEFRGNPEMVARWFNPDGAVNRDKIIAAKDVYDLVVPSQSRALILNKAYRVIVEDQDFLYGRDATVQAPDNVYDFVDNETAPTLSEEHIYDWDIRLNWNQQSSPERHAAR